MNSNFATTLSVPTTAVDGASIRADSVATEAATSNLCNGISTATLEKNNGDDNTNPHNNNNNRKDQNNNNHSHEAPESKKRKRSKKEMNAEQRKEAFLMLLRKVRLGTLPTGSYTEVAQRFDVGYRTIARQWHETLSRMHLNLENQSEIDAILVANSASETTTDKKEQKRTNVLPRSDACFRTNKHKSGRKRLWDRNEIMEAVRGLPPEQRKSYRKISAALGIPLTTIHNYKVREELLQAEANEAAAAAAAHASNAATNNSRTRPGHPQRIGIGEHGNAPEIPNTTAKDAKLEADPLRPVVQPLIASLFQHVTPTNNRQLLWNILLQIFHPGKNLGTVEAAVQYLTSFYQFLPTPPQKTSSSSSSRGNTNQQPPPPEAPKEAIHSLLTLPYSRNEVTLSLKRIRASNTI